MYIALSVSMHSISARYSVPTATDRYGCLPHAMSTAARIGHRQHYTNRVYLHIDSAVDGRIGVIRDRIFQHHLS